MSFRRISLVFCLWFLISVRRLGCDQTLSLYLVLEDNLVYDLSKEFCYLSRRWRQRDERKDMKETIKRRVSLYELYKFLSSWLLHHHFSFSWWSRDLDFDSILSSFPWSECYLSVAQIAWFIFAWFPFWASWGSRSVNQALMIIITIFGASTYYIVCHFLFVRNESAFGSQISRQP